jgi:hypothetical protein
VCSSDLDIEADGQTGCARFISAQVKNMPGYFKIPFWVLAFFIQMLSLLKARGIFTRIDNERRMDIIRVFSLAPGPSREFIRFFRVLVTFYFFSLLPKE